MTKQEKEKIKKAMLFIHPNDDSEGDHHAGMDILAKLVGIKVYDLEEIKMVPISKIPKNSKFKAPGITD